MNIENASIFLKKHKLKITIAFIIVTSFVSIIVLFSSLVYIKSNAKKLNLNFKDRLAKIKKKI
ncbi:Cation transport ATPase [Borrelia hermsii YBT]|nr:Cation transport ATPase [Borrelia hermsii YBT]